MGSNIQNANMCLCTSLQTEMFKVCQYIYNISPSYMNTIILLPENIDV